MRSLGTCVAALALMALPVTAQQAPLAPAATDTSAIAVVRRFVQAFNDRDIDQMVSMLGPNFVWLNVAGDSVAVEVRGAGPLRGSMEAYFRQLPSARSELEKVSVLGPWVSTIERAHWTSSGGPRSQAAVAIYEVRHGLVQRVWYYPAVR